ncbi:TonB-dependent receptor plug domain-containing protein [Cognataquiflexum rubidum]|uniref:TonB-dependent receptor plug domain-containing protein n=1 Tax=Cognataquiflexum rubidum TaxID=2922273 RepID=UPI001F12CC6A|nr:TonB-dependent receptor plug domain-containing protein [Cognataquiflexum rubidum]MCH6234697.1 TonB-dependent receptor plug domain-containing protein [Cognataquiflexum rubidum]
MLRFLIISIGLLQFAFSLKAQESDSLRMEQKPFNQGLILSLPQAIQSQIPGLLVSRPGSNPNGNFDMIYRGYHTFLGRMQPMLMLDGMPGLAWHMVDPFLIDSMSVRRGSQLAQMGLQAAAGVFDATISNNGREGLSVTFLQNVSMENYQRPYDNLNAQEYRNQAPPGTFFGNSDTDWLEALTQTAWSTNTGLKLGYRTGNLNSKVILSHRNVAGIQKETGFKQLSIYGALDYSFLKNKVKAGVSTLVVDRDSDIGNSYFFQAVVGMNPTFALDQQVNTYTGFRGNPWLRMNADQNTLDSKMEMFQANITANPFPQWTISGRIGKVGTMKDQFIFDGIMVLSNEAGTFQTSKKREDDRTFMEFSSDYLIQTNDFTFNPGIRFTSQKIRYDQTGTNLIRPFEPENTIIEQTLNPQYGEYTLNALGFFIHSNWKERLYFDFLYQPESSSNLGENAGWGQFFGMDLKYRLSPKFQVFTSYSHTGLIPDRTGLSQTILQIEPSPRITHYANPDLKWEDTYQWEIGGRGSFLENKLFAELRFFTSRSSDFINLMRAYDWDYTDWNAYYPSTYQNFGEIRNRGSEWVIGLNAVKIGNVFYQSSINATFLNSEWKDLDAEFTSLEGYDVGVTRAIGFGSHYEYNTLRTGEQIGTGRALEFLGIDRNTGQWILQQDNNQQDLRKNYVPQGQTVPKWWMGWNHQLQWKKWHLDAFFRGVFGHVNANETNLWYGGVTLSNQNVLRSFQNLKDQGLTDYNRFSSYFIEKSGFISLHYLSVSRDLDFLIKNKKVSSKISLIANNLFYITAYSAADPEARISARPIWQSDEHIEYYDHYYSSGIDGANTWLPSRAFTVSYQVNF